MSASLLAQTIRVEGRALDMETREPVPFVTVFVNNSSYGTVADENGLFELEVPEGRQELILSLVGYENMVWYHNFSGDLPSFAFEMVQKPIELKELKVEANRTEEWYENLKYFEYHFLGNSRNGLGCEIVNPEVLVIDFDQSVLKVHSTDFLIVENNRLGYRIKYLLNSFELDTCERVVHFIGYPKYSELEGGRTKQRRWKKNRASVFQGSWLHFKRSLRAGTTKEAGFEVRKMRKIPNSDRPTESQPREARSGLNDNGDLKAGNLRDSQRSITENGSHPEIIYKTEPKLLKETEYSSVDDGRIILDFEEYLEVTYTEGKVSREYINSFVPGKGPEKKEPVSSLRIMEPVTIFSTGLESNPLHMFFEGYWAWQKIGDMLPLDYEFPE